MINIGKYIETAINWLTENFAPLFDAINVGIGGFIDGFQNILMWIPFYVTIALLAILAWYKSGKGVSIFTILGLLLIWGMGFWNETMQTLALVLSSRHVSYTGHPLITVAVTTGDAFAAWPLLAVVSFAPRSVSSHRRCLGMRLRLGKCDGPVRQWRDAVAACGLFCAISSTTTVRPYAEAK